MRKQFCETTLNPCFGGEVKEVIKRLRKKIVTCTCGQPISLTDFKGQRHGDGYFDKDWNKWWIYARCPLCGFAWSAPMLFKRLKMSDPLEER